MNIIFFRTSGLQVLSRTSIAIFTKKDLRWSLFSVVLQNYIIQLYWKGPYHRYFLINFAKASWATFHRTLKHDNLCLFNNFLLIHCHWNDWNDLTVSTKCSILYVWLGFACPSVSPKIWVVQSKQIDTEPG